MNAWLLVAHTAVWAWIDLLLGGKHALDAELALAILAETVLLTQLGTDLGGERIIVGPAEIRDFNTGRVGQSPRPAGGDNRDLAAATKSDHGRLELDAVDGIDDIVVTSCKVALEIIAGNEVIDKFYLAIGIDRTDAIRHGANLLLSEGAVKGVELAIDIGWADVVVIDQCQTAYRGARQGLDRP